MTDTDMRNAAQSAVVAHVQDITEKKSILLSRTLHDELGGHLVSAVMDLGWVEQHLTSAEDIRMRLTRVRHALAAAIELKRQLIEELRPSLLDNFGLLAAFRWHVKHSCQRAGAACVESYPDEEPVLRPEALTGLFRIMQELLGMITAEELVSKIDVSVAMPDRRFEMRVLHEHVGLECDDMRLQAAALGAIEHRVRSLSGTMSVEHMQKGGVVTVEFPLDQLLAAA